MKTLVLTFSLILGITVMATGCVVTPDEDPAGSSVPAPAEPTPREALDQAPAAAVSSPLAEGIGQLCIGRAPCCEHSDTNPNRCTVLAVCPLGWWECP